MKNILKHITDVGSAFGAGIDSNIRIEKQYEKLGIVPKVIPAGHSPLHVAFAACTELSKKAENNVQKILKDLNIIIEEKSPIALNSAPRNSAKSQDDGQEDHIYKISFSNKEVFLIYGFEVLRWVLEFYNDENTKIERIISIKDVIPDTSKGSQFRSAEHLPIVHFLEFKKELNNYGEIETIQKESIQKNFENKETEIIIAPPDEYGNGRLIVDKILLEKILNKKSIKIPTITSKELPVKESLTEITPGELSIWISSNHFPNKNLKVLNIGTRWKEKTTKTTSTDTIELVKRLSSKIGESHKIIL